MLKSESESGAEFASVFNRVAEIYINKGDLGRAIPKLTRAIQSVADGDPALFSRRGDLYARQRQWKQAAADFVRFSELGSDDSIAWMRGAVLLAKIDDVEGYREYCRRMLSHFEGTDRTEIAERTAKVCLLVPPVASELEAVLKMADRAVTLNPGPQLMPWVQLAKGLAEYRAGHHESAIQWCEKGVKGQRPGQSIYPWYRTAMAHSVQAMAHYRLNQLDEARDELAKGSEVLEAQSKRYESRGLDGAWSDWLICQILHREADALIGDKADATESGDGPPRKPGK